MKASRGGSSRTATATQRKPIFRNKTEEKKSKPNKISSSDILSTAVSDYHIEQSYTHTLFLPSKKSYCTE